MVSIYSLEVEVQPDNLLRNASFCAYFANITSPAGGSSRGPILPSRLLPADVTHAPYAVGPVVGEDQRAVCRYGNANWPAPNFPVLDDESGDEILVLPGCFSVSQRDADDFVPRALSPIPGAVLGGKCITTILGWKLRARVKGHLQGRGM